MWNNINALDRWVSYADVLTVRCPEGVFVPFGDTMARPEITPSSLGVERASVINLLRSGRINVDDAARILKCHRKTIWRLCHRFGIDPDTAHRRYVDRLTWRLRLNRVT